MFKIQEEDKLELVQICENYQVNQLELFGSATTDHFDENTSDLDFLVQFKKMNPVNHYECYFGLKETLENKFQKKVDLVELSTIDNPYFLKEIQSQRMTLYAK